MNNKYLLSLDGGGVREIATVTFLAKLEKELGKMDPFLRHCFKVWIPLREHFRDPIT